MYQDKSNESKRQANLAKADLIWQNLIVFVEPVLEQIAKQLDGRLVKTMCELLKALLIHRNRTQGMVLSELGGVIAGETHAPAGVKRIARLLYSERWTGEVIENYLWALGDERVNELQPFLAFPSLEFHFLLAVIFLV